MLHPYPCEGSGFKKVLKMTVSGCSRKVLAEFAGPTRSMLQNLPLSLSSKLVTASAKDWWEILFHSNTSWAQLNQTPLQSWEQVPSFAFSKISSRDNLLLWSLLLDSAISQPELGASATAFGPLFRINSTKSVFPSCFVRLPKPAARCGF